MAQYSSYNLPIEAYVVGDVAPAWVEQAYKDRYLAKELKGKTMLKIFVGTPEGPKTAVTGDAIVRKSAKSFDVIPALTFTASYLLDDAELTSVLTKTDATPGDLSGKTPATAIAWELSVANAVSTVGRTNIVAGTDATFKLYSDATFETEIKNTATISLTAGTAVKAYIAVTSKHGTLLKHYAVAITRAES